MMNLLDDTRIRRHWPACGSVIPQTHQFARVPPEWSRPKLRVFDHADATRLDALVSAFLADDLVHVIAVSPAAVGPGWWLYDHTPGGEPVPHFAVTVTYQDRLPTTASDPVDPIQAIA